MYKSIIILSSIALSFTVGCSTKSETILSEKEVVILCAEAKPMETVVASYCPNGMAEIEGDFCPSTDIDSACTKLDMTIHNANGYVKCDEFRQVKCLSDKRVHMHFCMDTYEWPNKKGAIPAVMVSWDDMAKNCQTEDKRLCRDVEWTFACEGEDILPYPYGLKRDSTACNIDHDQRPGFDPSKDLMTPAVVAWLDQRVPSGSMEKCVSPFGIHDMTGNVDESVINSPSKPFKSAEMGGHWVRGARNRCRPRTIVHEESFKFYEIGGRCCAK